MKYRSIFNATVLVSALGYFVDIYDLVLFSIVRVASLKGINVADNQILDVGVLLLNMQMLGMLIGGVLWGIIGDRRGRLSVLFGSIALYSIANILNAFVTNVPSYAALRFLAGIGLAGELGAAITLVSEILSKELRGYGTTIVASVGICGAILAGTVGDYFSWKTSYIVGGCLGFVLLLLRIGTIESMMFHQTKIQANVRRGDLRMLFLSGDRVKRYLYSIMIGVPLWYVVGILATFAPELTHEMGATGPISAGRAILFLYLGLTIGDLASGLISQWWGSRRKVVFLFLLITLTFVITFHVWREISPPQFYSLCVLIGVGAGYWAVFVSAAAEQFGTNLRATVTTTVPNFVRGFTVPMTIAFRLLPTLAGVSRVQSSAILAVAVFGLAFIGVYCLRETFGRDLNFVEE